MRLSQLPSSWVGRLNRTSVGLKPGRYILTSFQKGLPQSNQRGIETLNQNICNQDGIAASIEPAWD